MCLAIVASTNPNSKGRVTARHLSKMTGLAIKPYQLNGFPALHFSLFGDCSCDFLSGSVDPECNTWTFEEFLLPALVEAINELSQKCAHFSFIAFWFSEERPRTTLQTSAESLVKLVTENKIANNVLYVV